MLAEKIMVTNVVTAHANDSVADVLKHMRQEKLRMVPIINDDSIIVGVVSTFSIMEKVVPSYIVTGDLNQIAFAPDLGILRRHYKDVAQLKAHEIMDKKPLTVNRDESLLSVAAAMVSFTKHEYAMVIDEQNKLLGIVSAGDILDRLQVTKEDGNDA